MSKIKAVIFDIDGTLTTRICWNYLVEYLGGSPEAEQKNYQDWQKGLITPEQADKKIMELWRGSGRGIKSEFIKAFETLPLRSDALEIVDYLKSKKIIVCLITGAMDLYAEVIARRLDIEHYYANAVLHWNSKDEIESFDYEPNQADKKLQQFQEFCRTHNLIAEDCVAVGDSANDYELFKVTKKGIAIRSMYEDKILEQLAWQVVDQLSEIKKLI